MRKAIFTFVLSIIFSGIMLSQVYQPLIRENVYWDINHLNASLICYSDGRDRYYFEGDTLINNEVYKVLKAHPMYTLSIGSPFCPPFAVDYSISNIMGFWKEDTIARQVFALDQYSFGVDSNVLIYDFSLEQGDTISFGNYLTIDSVSTVQLANGAVRKILYCGYPDFFFIEGIGGSSGLVNNMAIGLGFQDVPMCVTENDTILWGNECSYVLPTNKIEQPEAIKVYLATSQNILFVERENAKTEKFQLFDLYGRLVLEKEIQAVFEAIDLPKLAQGVYIYAVGEQQRGRVMVGG